MLKGTFCAVEIFIPIGNLSDFHDIELSVSVGIVTKPIQSWDDEHWKQLLNFVVLGYVWSPLFMSEYKNI